MSWLLAALGISLAASAGAAEIRVYSGGAPQVALKVLAPEFERATGHKLAFTYAVVGEIRKRLEAGEKADVILLPVPLLNALEKGGALRPDSRRALARVGIGVIVREGAPQPDISSADSVRKALLDARSIAYSDPKLTPGGKHLAGMIAKLGIAEVVGPKSILKNAIDGGAALVASGEVELGMFLVSEVQSMKGITVVGLLPTQLQNYVAYAGAVAAGSSLEEPAQAFLKFLTDPANQTHWKAAGFEPSSGAK
jgi:molybdate transport system substrate-binding protein